MNIINKKKIYIYEYISVYELSIKINIDIKIIFNICNSLGVKVTNNFRLDKELIILICNDLNLNIIFIDEINNFLIDEHNKKKKYIIRPLLVTILGHVNHGKTSLLDYIRKSNLTKLEYGNITQHIGIYNVKIDNKRSITFIDTPGHESFLSIRSRSIKISDIVLIIISVDKGIMEQTIESINNIKNYNLLTIFVFTKIDKINNFNLNINNIINDLKKFNIDFEKNENFFWVKVSVKKGYGINSLLKKIFFLSKNINLLTNINSKNCYGIIIESYLDKKKGFLVKILVQNGILKLGDSLISYIYYCKIKNIINENNKSINKVTPFIPVIIIGFNGAPLPGSKFIVINNKNINLKKLCIERIKLLNNNNINFIKKNKYNINVIIKTDVDSSLIVLLDEINKLGFINIIYKSIGDINKSDYNLSIAFNSLIIGFNVKINFKKNNKINNIFIFNIIYDVIKFLKLKILKSNNKNINKIGLSKIIKIFNIKNKVVYGCVVLNGYILINNYVNIIRNNIKIFKKIKILSLKILNNNVLKVKANENFGIIFNIKKNLLINDLIESYNI
ncbi:MAG: translation initiation factor IF-2 N-terminal domain-containing protein [Candidatus Shikimatogenerans sp. JK-2022]|nr:translation initiation factor IF-2 N-terminal domain-containing protein [Candidatus Shikimatogenerans bostrichidophilus]